jgi:outer membrane protein
MMGIPVLLAISVPTLLTLAEAERIGSSEQPDLRQQHALSEAASARTEEAYAPLLPQLGANGQYSRQTANFTARPGSVPSGVASAQSRTSFDTFNYFSFGITASQLLYDFGQAKGRHDSARASGDAAIENEAASRLKVAAAIRVAFFGARAQKELVDVAKRTLASEEKHFAQVQGFVEVKTRPAIDLAQARQGLANAKFQLISAEGSYATAKAALNQTMGVLWPTTYDVANDDLAAVNGEAGPVESLIDQATSTRHELTALDKQVEAARFTEIATHGGYGPTVGVSTTLSEAGTQLGSMTWNWNAQAQANWPLFEGGITTAKLREAQATRLALEAQREGLRQSVRLEVQRARISIETALAGLAAASEVVASAEERLGLAEGRYAAGVGTLLELSDAQLGATTAAAQKVQAQYTLASARAQLLLALGRER